jgi:hypothetical protein
VLVLCVYIYMFQCSGGMYGKIKGKEKSYSVLSPVIHAI